MAPICISRQHNPFCRNTKISSIISHRIDPRGGFCDLLNNFKVEGIMIRVLIVDDQSLIREGLRMMLSLYDNIQLVGEADNGKEAIEILDKDQVDLILMDIRMPIMDGVEATGIIKERYPETKVLILTTFNE